MTTSNEAGHPLLVTPDWSDYVKVNKRGALISWNFLSFCRFHTGSRILTFDGVLNPRLLNLNVEISLHLEQGHSL